MAPWWSRPTADGDNEEPHQASGEARLSDLAAAEPAADEDDDEPEEAAVPARRGRTRQGRSGRGAAGDDDKASEEPAAAKPAAKRTGRAARSAASRESAPSKEPAGKESAGKSAASHPAAAKPAGKSSASEGGGGASDEPAGRRQGRSAAAAVPSHEQPAAKPKAPAKPAAKQEERSGNGRQRERPRAEREEEERPASRGTRDSLRPGDTVSVPVSGLDDLAREIVITLPERTPDWEEERKLALFCDFENVALGVRESGMPFDINRVLERLVEKGKIIVKKAYCDWTRYSDYKRAFHEAGIELIDIPQKHYSGKNSADIKMVVDAMDLSYSKEHLDTFVILSGDSDFSPLVSKLKENNKHVIGVGVKGSSSNLLIDSCDEFIYYEDIHRDLARGPKLESLSKKEKEVFELLVDSIQALVRENKDVLWGSMVKQTMQRKRPSFNEGYYGYSTFSELLEDAEEKNILKLKKDQRSGSYIVTGFTKRR